MSRKLNMGNLSVLNGALDAARRPALFEDGGADFRVIDIDLIDPNPDQPRTEFDEGALCELAESIERFGLIQPIVVREKPGGRFELIAGERRKRATEMNGKGVIQALVRSSDDSAMLAMIENVQRKDLTPIEEAQGYRALLDLYDVQQNELAKRLGKSSSEISRKLRMLELPAQILAELKAGTDKVSKAALLEIVDAKDPALQLSLWEAAKSGVPALALRDLKKQDQPASAGTKAPVSVVEKLVASADRMKVAVAKVVAEKPDLTDDQRAALERLRDEIDGLLRG